MIHQTTFTDIISDIIHTETLISMVLSAPRQKDQPQKITIRPLLIKGKFLYQCTEQQGQKAIHHNLSKEECISFLEIQVLKFKQTFITTTHANYQILVGKKDHITILKKPISKSSPQLNHNREKAYLIKENKPIPFLIELGVMNHEGKIFTHKRDKFKQINRFLEMVEDILSCFQSLQPIHIVDFGSGKSYLTFALYYYLKIIKGFPLTITGIDLKPDMIQHCQELAQRLGYVDLCFVLGDINQFEETKKVNMVVSLHACDTATDAALEKAIRWKSDVILCVPCCQHELYSQVENKDLAPLLKHGILKERFASLATDAARAQLLEALGYHVQILEFIDLEHTPKNLLIRAIKRENQKKKDEIAWKSYLSFKMHLNINPSLEKRFKEELEHIEEKD